MKRRRFVLVTVAGLVAPRAALAQPARKGARIGYLSGLSAEAGKSWLAAFHAGMRELGYVEGTNFFFEQRYASGKYDLLPALAAELAALKLDVSLVYGAEAALAMNQAAGTLPIVMANVQDPVVSGLVSSLARPGGNVTGLSDFHAASVTKRLELLKEMVPSLSRLAVLWRPGQASHPLQLKDLEASVSATGVTIAPFPVKGLDEIERAFPKMKNERAGALLLLGDAILTTHHRRIAELALKNRLPAMYTIRPFVQAGGLVSYGTDFAHMFRRAATYVDHILKGAKPGDLPIEQPTKFDLVINLKTAKALGITVPRSVLLRADQVIE